MTRVLVMLTVAACVLPASTASAQECVAALSAPALDHVVLVVRDLDRASATFRAHGFRLKEGRLHANNLLNRHVKFRDGSSLELMTLHGEPLDGMARDYAALADSGEGGVYVALQTGSVAIVEEAAVASGFDSVRSSSGAWSFLSFPAASPAAAVFFSEGVPAVQDPDSLVSHEPDVYGLAEVWIEGGVELTGLLETLGAARCGSARSPDGRTGERLALARGSIVVVERAGPARPRVLGAVLGLRADGGSTVWPHPGFWVHYRHGRRVDLSRHFDGGEPVEATFVLVNGTTGEVTRYNPARAAERFLPASTFKIPHTLIALETGVASDGDFLLQFDSTRVGGGFWSPEWSRDHTLRSAFQHSVYWYYQETARRIGDARMAEYLDRFDYGNQSMHGGLDRFWLGGGLRISPDEQVRFLQRMYEGGLDVSDRSLSILKSIMVLEQGPDYTLSGKTGTADVTPTRELAWLVGYVERAGDVWYFALNMEGEEVWERWGHPTARRTLVSEILYELGVLPGSR